MPWRTSKVAEQRMEFVAMASRREKSFTELCEEFQISCRTGYTWWNRYKADGLDGMQERSRRPHHSPRRTSNQLERRIVELRQQRPDWGARKVRQLLQQEGIHLPASTIHRIFLRYDLVRDCDRRPGAQQRFEREHPNQLWQMDFKGPKGWNQPLGPLSVLDDHSRYAVALENTGSTQAQSVQAVLERAFRENGVPQEMLMDHGTPWFNTQGRLGWSQLTVWLMDRDIQLYFSGCRHPQTQGKVERFHRSMTAALLRRGTPTDAERQPWLDAFRYEYNYVRPHEALQMKTPHQVWHKSSRKFQEQAPAWDYAAGSELKEIDRIGQLRLDRRRYYISKALAGRQVGLLEVEQRILVYYRQTLVCELDPLQSRSFAGDRAWSCNITVPKV
jgi:transposase InsO family protein